MKRINDWIGYQTTNGVGTMWTAYLFFLWALLPLVLPQAQNVVQYVSQSVIQLVLLPIIIVGQNVAAQITEKRDIETHDSVMKEFDEIKQMHLEQAYELAELKSMHKESQQEIANQHEMLNELKGMHQEVRQQHSALVTVLTRFIGDEEELHG